LFSAIFAALNIGGKSGAAEGRGILRFTVENNELHVAQLAYRNRGADLFAAGTVQDVWRLPNTALSGWAAGSVTPLKEIKLPILSDAQTIFRTLELNATTFRLGGTVRDPKITPVPFSEVGETIRGILLGATGQ